jgi:hypothetical protein
MDNEMTKQNVIASEAKQTRKNNKYKTANKTVVNIRIASCFALRSSQ